MKWMLRWFEEPIGQDDATDLRHEKAKARAALARTTEALEQAKALTPEANRLGRTFREIRRKNHFIELIEDSLGRST